MKKTLVVISTMLLCNVASAQLPPIANNDFDTVIANFQLILDVTANDLDPDGDLIEIISTYTENAQVNIFFDEADGRYKLEYKANEEFSGIDTLTYMIADTLSFPPIEQDTGYAFITVKTYLRNYTVSANNILIIIEAFDDYFSEFFPFNYRFSIPKDSLTNTVVYPNIWTCGTKPTGEKLIAKNLDPYFLNNFQFGPICDNEDIYSDDEYKNKWSKAWGLTKDQINYHRQHCNEPDYLMPTDIEIWPAHGDTELGQAENLAPYIDANENGFYDPKNGDYPIIYGDQAAYFIVNDMVRGNNTPQREPMSIEVHCMIFAFDSPENEGFWNTLFMNYKIYNKSEFQLDSAYIGAFSRLPIGYSDDYAKSDIEKSAVIAYNMDTYDGDTNTIFGAFPPAQASMILKGPNIDEDGIDNPDYDPNNPNENTFAINGFGYNDGIIDNECLGMAKFIKSNYSSDSTKIPYSGDKTEYINLLYGKFRYGQPMYFGGDGFPGHENVTDIPASFMYPDESDENNWGTMSTYYPTGWDQTNYINYPWNQDNENNQPGNCVSLSSMGPFTFESGSMEDIFIGFVFARDTVNDDRSLSLINERMENILTAFRNNEAPGGGTIYGIEENYINKEYSNSLLVYPNPATNIIYLDTDVKEGKLVILDMYGRIVMTHSLDNGNKQINISCLKTGMYLLTLKNNNKTQSYKLLKK